MFPEDKETKQYIHLAKVENNIQKQNIYRKRRGKQGKTIKKEINVTVKKTVFNQEKKVYSKQGIDYQLKLQKK